MGFKRGFELIAQKAGAAVVPVHLESLWGSIFSFSGGRYFWKWPREWPRRIGLLVRVPALPSTVTAEEARQAVLDLGERAFRNRPALAENLGHAALRRLAAAPWKRLVLDCTREPVAASCAQVLAASLVLARRWRGLRGHRVGVALPPGTRRANRESRPGLRREGPGQFEPDPPPAKRPLASLAAAGIEEIVTRRGGAQAGARLPRGPSPIESGISSTSSARSPRRRWPPPSSAPGSCRAASLARLCRIEAQGGDREAVLLFTSGSSGDPKGVILTHANILANVSQVFAAEIVASRDRILGCLPLFHSFGMTFTLWAPLLRQIEVVTTPSPLDAAKVGAAIAAGKATILLGTPTFLRAYARKVEPAAFASCASSSPGRRSFPPTWWRSTREKYRVEIFEGYGLTETAPVLAVNLPPPRRGFAADSTQEAGRAGSVGRLLPGIAYRLADPETGRSIESREVGLLQVRGANVFPGYLGDAARTEERCATAGSAPGDLARVDADGFLFIEGRLSPLRQDRRGDGAAGAAWRRRSSKPWTCGPMPVPPSPSCPCPIRRRGRSWCCSPCSPSTGKPSAASWPRRGCRTSGSRASSARSPRSPLLGTGKTDWARLPGIGRRSRRRHRGPRLNFSLHPVRGLAGCCHLLVQDGEAVLLDTGLVGEVGKIGRLLSRLGLGFPSIRAIVLTHGHLDHAGNLARLVELSGAPVYGHPDEQAHIDGAYPYRGWARGCGMLEAIGRPLLRYRPRPDHPFSSKTARNCRSGAACRCCTSPAIRRDIADSTASETTCFSAAISLPATGSASTCPRPSSTAARSGCRAAWSAFGALNPARILPNHYDRPNGGTAPPTLRQAAESAPRMILALLKPAWAFPVVLHLGPWQVPIHPVTDVLAYGLGFRFYLWLLRRHPAPALPVEQRAWLFVGCIFGAPDRGQVARLGRGAPPLLAAAARSGGLDRRQDDRGRPPRRLDRHRDRQEGGGDLRLDRRSLRLPAHPGDGDRARRLLPDRSRRPDLGAVPPGFPGDSTSATASRCTRLPSTRSSSWPPWAFSSGG